MGARQSFMHSTTSSTDVFIENIVTYEAAIVGTDSGGNSVTSKDRGEVLDNDVVDVSRRTSGYRE